MRRIPAGPKKLFATPTPSAPGATLKPSDTLSFSILDLAARSRPPTGRMILSYQSNTLFTQNTSKPFGEQFFRSEVSSNVNSKVFVLAFDSDPLIDRDWTATNDFGKVPVWSDRTSEKLEITDKATSVGWCDRFRHAIRRRLPTKPRPGIVTECH